MRTQRGHWSNSQRRGLEPIRKLKLIGVAGVGATRNLGAGAPRLPFGPAPATQYRFPDRLLAGSHRRPDRDGISLIEMVVVISIMAGMLSGGVVLLGLLLRADTAGHDAMTEQITTSRLNRQFRADAHLCTSVAEPAKPAGALELQLVDGSRVVWAAAGDVLTRTVHRDDSIVARESFTIGDGVFSLTREPSGNLIAIRHSRPYTAPLADGTDDRPQPQVELRIQAAVGIGVGTAVNANAGPATPATGDTN